MHSGFRAGAVLTILLASAAHAQDAKPAEAVSYDRDVKPILRKRCGNCHNSERPRGELDLMTFAGVVAGGASGKAAVAGHPEESPIYTQPAHLEDPKMPPNAPKIPQREIDVLRRWVEGGLLERSGDSPSGGTVAAVLAPAATLVSPVVPPRASAISALAVSPVAPLAAVSGHRQVLVFDLAAHKLLGALPFPEGDLFALGFSRDGQTLFAAGGVGAESGKVVLFRTKNWSRAGTVGDELDAVLAADLAPDGARVVLGGPSRVVKVVGNPGGEAIHTFRKPTDWVTAASFSPDGLLVAAGDRFGGLFLWEARSGHEFLTLRGHLKTITAIAWDPEGDQLLTAGEDGLIHVCDLHTGTVTHRWEAHAGGVLSLDVHGSGRIVSGGRDRHIKVWGPAGAALSDLGPGPAETTRVAWTADGGAVVAGDLSGEVRAWTLADSSWVRLPLPVAIKPPAVAMVAPVLSPARPLTKAVAATVSAGKPGVASGETLEAALSAARDSARAAERTVATLAKLLEARGVGPTRESSAGDALSAARAALVALEAAVAAEPNNLALRRALEETERAVKSLETKRDRLKLSDHGDR